MYEVKAMYEKTLEDGRVKKVKEAYLFDASSVTDAEARALETLAPYTTGELEVKSVKEVDYSEVMLDGDGDKYYEAKIAIITLDEKTGKEKKTPSSILVIGSDFDSALKRFKDGMKDSIIDWELERFQLTKIVEAFLTSE